jgi:cytochrome c oxidase cbb3-type subunit 4
MDTYSFLREFADSWILLAMFAFFAGAAIWAFLPSQSSAREDASMIPFRNDNDDSTVPNPKGESHNMEDMSHD